MLKSLRLRKFGRQEGRGIIEETCVGNDSQTTLMAKHDETLAHELLRTIKYHSYLPVPTDRKLRTQMVEAPFTAVSITTFADPCSC